MGKVPAVITARGGSKGIPRKNIALLGGKPLICWSIECALASSSIDLVLVSTDDEEIASIARQSGAEVPFLRPPELARDDSPHVQVVVHATRWIMNEYSCNPDYVLLLQPTSPFRKVEDIDESLRLARQKNADAVVSVCEAASHPYKTYSISSNGALQSFCRSPEGYQPRQASPGFYAENGAIYLTRRDTLLSRQTLRPPESFAYVMPPDRSLDIDTAWDMHVATLIANDLAGKIPTRTPFSTGKT